MKQSSLRIPLSVGRLEQNVFSWRRKVVVATAAATALPTACSTLAVRRQEKALSPVRRRVRGTTRSRSKVSNGSQNVARVVGATSSEGFLVTSTEIRRANVEMTARCVIWVGPRRHPSGLVDLIQSSFCGSATDEWLRTCMAPSSVLQWRHCCTRNRDGQSTKRTASTRFVLRVPVGLRCTFK